MYNYVEVQAIVNDWWIYLKFTHALKSRLKSLVRTSMFHACEKAKCQPVIRYLFI